VIFGDFFCRKSGNTDLMSKILKIAQCSASKIRKEKEKETMEGNKLKIILMFTGSDEDIMTTRELREIAQMKKASLHESLMEIFPEVRTSQLPGPRRLLLIENTMDCGSKHHWNDCHQGISLFLLAPNSRLIHWQQRFCISPWKWKAPWNQSISWTSRKLCVESLKMEKRKWSWSNQQQEDKSLNTAPWDLSCRIATKPGTFTRLATWQHLLTVAL